LYADVSLSLDDTMLSYVHSITIIYDQLAAYHLRVELVAESCLLPSNRQYLSSVACLEDKREDTQNCSCCVVYDFYAQ